VNRPNAGGEDRRRLFRRMERVYVYGPPALALLVSVIGASVFAFLAPIDGTTYWGRWALAILVILVLPVAVYVVKSHLEK